MEPQVELDGLLREVAVDDLPTCPSVACRILEIAGQSSISLPDLENALLYDPALTAKVMRLANSSLFGTSGRISDMRHALARVDVHIARLVALSFTLDPGVEHAEGFDYLRYWQHSGAMALVAPRLARHFPEVHIDEAHVAGLLSGIGQLLLARAMGPKYASICLEARKTGQPIEMVERERLGADHATHAGRVLADWLLPECLARAIGVHLQPSAIERAEPLARELAKVLHLSWLIVEHLLGRDGNQAAVIRVWMEVWAKLDEEACDVFLDWIRSELEPLDRLYQDQTGDPQVILEQARKQMVQASLATATNLALTVRKAEATQQQVEELRRQQAQLVQQVTTDPLTGIGNRKFFDARIEEEIKRCQRHGAPLSLIMFDLDHFKDLNDSYGHPAGDEVLRRTTETARACLRISDVVARYGGEEFMVIAPETGEEGAVASAERMRLRLEELRVPFGGRHLAITASFGVATVESSERLTDSQQLIRMVDECLYEAKGAGRNCVRSVVL